MFRARETWVHYFRQNLQNTIERNAKNITLHCERWIGVKDAFDAQYFHHWPHDWMCADATTTKAVCRWL